MSQDVEIVEHLKRVEEAIAGAKAVLDDIEVKIDEVKTDGAIRVVTE